MTKIELLQDWSGRKKGDELGRGFHPGFLLSLVERGIGKLIEGPVGTAPKVNQETISQKNVTVTRETEIVNNDIASAVESDSRPDNSTAKRSGRKKAARNRDG